MEIMKKIMDQSEKKRSSRQNEASCQHIPDSQANGRSQGHMAMYRLIPSITLAMSNVTCQFVQTGPKADRSIMWKKATEE